MVIGEPMEQDKGKTLRPSVIEDHIPKNNIEVGLKIEQQKIRDYDSPEFIPSELEETRITEPWRKGMIVKMLERRICYKYLENRLQEIFEHNTERYEARRDLEKTWSESNGLMGASTSGVKDNNDVANIGPWLVVQKQRNGHKYKIGNEVKSSNGVARSFELLTS
ncbi:hypothetical protein KIW84_065254 [Lathyrus oleraceus]|uniref:Uncharacterized protein n=1 Tax=Pisum sativum TaxID=3888 RepID=A0A9D5A9D4_PEA|nr:hypothetical protein KIW84_065254 [Pisum sativum]